MALPLLLTFCLGGTPTVLPHGALPSACSAPVPPPHFGRLVGVDEDPSPDFEAVCDDDGDGTNWFRRAHATPTDRGRTPYGSADVLFFPASGPVANPGPSIYALCTLRI
jgi:hypothetical protein